MQKLEKKEETTATFSNRNYDCFKARILDLPWQQTLKPVIDHFKEFEQIVSQKICKEFPTVLHTLQQEIVEIAFQETKYKGIQVVQRLDYEGEETSILLLQINLKTTDIPENKIINFYHNGMIDYLEFSLNPRTEQLLNNFGEKFILTAGNIASHSLTSTIGCKIFASFPAANENTYRPARKRVFITQKMEEHKFLKTLACKSQINFEKLQNIPQDFISEAQNTPWLPATFRWPRYKLLAEGHYIQIWAHTNWHMLLPFSGEGDTLLRVDDIINTEADIDTDQDSPVSIDSTHRDF